MPPLTRVLGLALLGAVSTLLLVWGSRPVAGAEVSRQLLAVLGASGLGGAALVWIALDRRFAATPLGAVLALALLLRLLAAQAWPLLEDDHFRYLWDGWRTATTLDPYRLPPSAYFGQAGLPAMWQDILGGINHPDTPTIYGPVQQGLFALAYAIAPGQLMPLQALLVLVDMAVLGLLVRHGVGRRWLLAYAVHPLVLREAIAAAHPDGLLALLLMLSLLAWQRRLAWAVGAMLGLALASKVAALVALPLLLFSPMADGRWRWAAAVGGSCAAVVGLLYLPFLAVGGSDAAALATFGSQWRFNPLLYRVVEMVAPAAAVRPLAGLLVGVGIGAIAWRWQRASAGAPPTLPPLDAALVWLLLLSPVVNPWYWLWVLALAVQRGRIAVVAIGVAAVLSHANSSVLAQAGLGPDAATAFTVAWPLALVQLLTFGVALAVDGWRRRSRRGR